MAACSEEPVGAWLILCCWFCCCSKLLLSVLQEQFADPDIGTERKSMLVCMCFHGVEVSVVVFDVLARRQMYCRVASAFVHCC